LIKKTGIYICKGCEIGKNLNTGSLADGIINEYQPAICKTHRSLCSSEAIDMIMNDIEKESLTDVIIAACSPRVYRERFEFSKEVNTERVNIREQVSWCNDPGEEDAQMLALDYIKMGIVKTRYTSSPNPYIPENLSSEILVVGGGITGITAAIEGAKAGYPVTLIEKKPVPGGWARELYRQLPSKPPYNKASEPEIGSLIEELHNTPGITIIVSANLKSISGQPGAFNATVESPHGVRKIRAGSIIAAQGWKPYPPERLSAFGYGLFPDVLTNVEFEQMAASQKIICPSTGKPPSSILFIQCAGSRDEHHLPYCSNFCCGTTLKQATYIREQLKKTSVFIIYKDLRMPGHYELFYNEVQKDDHTFFTKGEIKKISGEDGHLLVEVAHSLFNEDISIPVDMVVLATGMVPAGTDSLNLDYRLGKGLPELKYDFPDSHFICFPYETRRTGIYSAGAVRAPMDIPSAKEDAMGAMLKAIQCIEATKRGEAVHPRSGDRNYPELYFDRCTDCKRCTEECPFGAYDEDEKGTPLPNPSRCRRCGICLGSCPERVISFPDYSITGISQMIRAVHIPDEFTGKPRILAFVCENDAYPALDMAGFQRKFISPYIRVIPVRCIGSVNSVWISDALSHGFDGILLLGCKPGDDYQCHYMQGSELTGTRSENYRETLKTMMLEPERVHTEYVEITDFDKIPEIINGYVDTIKNIGPNPFKNM